MMAKFLGKPTVILRSDSRRMKNAGFDEPYNLMLKNYPRTVVLHLDSLMDYLDRWEALKPKGAQALTFDELIERGKWAIEKGVADLAAKVIKGFEEVQQMPSPYLPEMAKAVYQAARLLPGSGYDELVSAEDLEALLSRLKAHGTL
jgi:hypothetical protein